MGFRDCLLHSTSAQTDQIHQRTAETTKNDPLSRITPIKLGNNSIKSQSNTARNQQAVTIASPLLHERKIRSMIISSLFLSLSLYGVCMFYKIM